MIDSLVFIGKFNDSFRLLEEKIINNVIIEEEEEEIDDNDFNKNDEEEEEEEENDSDDNNNLEIAIDDLENEIKSYTNETPIQFKDGNSTIYDLYENSKKAIITKSPQAKGDFFIPTTVNFKSNEYEIIKIADEAFAGSSIESLSFATDSAILMIGNSVFKKSTLKKLFIPKNLKMFDDFWCKGANMLNEFEIDPENHFFSFKNGFFIHKNGNFQKILFAPRNIEGEFVIPKKITHIGQYSFYKRNDLLSVKSISSKLIKITDNSFYKCEKLKSIKIEQKTKLILGNSCFSQLQSLESVEITCKELKICDSCFCNSIFLSIFNLTCPGLVLLCSKAFEKCVSLNNISFKDSSEIRIEKECFNGASNFKSIDFSNVGQISLFSQSFKNSTDLQNISFSKSSEVYIENDCFSDTKLRSISFSEVNKIKLSPQAYMRCNTLEDVTVKNAKELIIGKECFKDSYQLKSIMFITDCISLGDKFVNGCNSFKFISIQTKVGELNIFPSTFKNTKLKSVILNGPKIKLYNECFKGIITLESLEIIGNDIEIGDKCIHNCQKLTSFTLKSEKFIKICLNMFLGCNSLKNVNIETHSNLNIFNDYFNPSSLTILNLEVDCISIDQNRFSGFKSLRKLIIKSRSTIALGMGCFSKSVNLVAVNLIGKDINIERSCFSDCSSLNEFIIDEAVNVTLGKGIFMKCKNLWTIDIGVVEDLIADEECFVSSSVEEVVFQGTKIDIGEKCFNGCSTLKKFHIISAETATLGIKAFEGCSNLETVNVNTSSKLKISDKCFYKNQKLKSIELLSKDLITGDYSFYTCSSIQFLTIGDSEKIVFGKNSFQNCSGLLGININAKNEFQASPNCFEGANQLKTVQIASNKVIICRHCFYMSSLMDSISILNADDTILGENAFECCKSLETVNVISNKFKARSFCFLNASKLKIININARTIIFCGHCFDKCSSLVQVKCQTADIIRLYETSFNGYPYNRYLNHKEDAKIEAVHFIPRENKNDSFFGFYFG